MLDIILSLVGLFMVIYGSSNNNSYITGMGGGIAVCIIILDIAKLFKNQ